MMIMMRGIVRTTIRRPPLASFATLTECTRRQRVLPLAHGNPLAMMELGIGSTSSSRTAAATLVKPRRPILVRAKHHQAKLGKHLQTLDELAHGQSQKLAQERRQKKKDRTTQKQGGGNKAAAKASQDNYADDDEDEDVEEGDDKIKGRQERAATRGRDDHTADTMEDDEDEADDNDDDDDDSVLPDPKRVKARMMGLVDKLEASLKKLRGAEPSPELFDDVLVDAYGSNVPLKSVAQVVLASSTLATATCYDPAMAKSVSVSIRNSLQLNPTVEEGGVVRIQLPRISMETRQQTAVMVGKRAESFRQKVRLMRRDALEIVKQGVAGKLDGISKDDAFRVQKEIEAATDDVIGHLNAVAEKKHNSIMAV